MVLAVRNAGSGRTFPLQTTHHSLHPTLYFPSLHYIAIIIPASPLTRAAAEPFITDCSAAAAAAGPAVVLASEPIDVPPCSPVRFSSSRVSRHFLIILTAFCSKMSNRCCTSATTAFRSSGRRDAACLMSPPRRCGMYLSLIGVYGCNFRGQVFWVCRGAQGWRRTQAERRRCCCWRRLRHHVPSVTRHCVG